MKFAVYVEGLSELLFVADFLQKYFTYDSAQCGIICINLNADDALKEMRYPKLGDESSKNYYQIVNVNNDNRVVSKMKKDLPRLLNNGFDVVIGLKDVYGSSYNNLENRSIVNRAVIEKLHKIQFDSICAGDSDCRLHFAIMEYEAWMLSLISHSVELKGFDVEDLFRQVKLDITQDPEVTIYHPYPKVREIFMLCGEDYNKHEKDMCSFLSTLSKDDYMNLKASNHCASYGKFIDSLLDFEKPVLP